jgi:hypothetical protein
VGRGFGDPNAASVTGRLGNSLWDDAGPRSSAADATATGSAVDAGRADDDDQPADSAQDSGSRPIFVWNPGASTDSFPAVPGD